MAFKGFRFRKSLRIAPGVRLNLSKSGFSTSIGRPGATVNLGHGRVKGTVGIPGSGLSYSAEIGKKRKRRQTSSVEAASSPRPPSPVVQRPRANDTAFAFETPGGAQVQIKPFGISTKVVVRTDGELHHFTLADAVGDGEGINLVMRTGEVVKVGPENVAQVGRLLAEHVGRQRLLKIVMPVTYTIFGVLGAFILLLIIGAAVS